MASGSRKPNRATGSSASTMFLSEPSTKPTENSDPQPPQTPKNCNPSIRAVLLPIYPLDTGVAWIALRSGHETHGALCCAGRERRVGAKCLGDIALALLDRLPGVLP